MRSAPRPTKNGYTMSPLVRNQGAESGAIEAAIVGSLAERVMLLDSQGTVVMVNPAWADGSQSAPIFESVRPGDNYFAVCERAASDGDTAIAAISEGVRAVANSHAPQYQATYMPRSDGAVCEAWMVTATPLRHRRGGVVVACANVSSLLSSTMAQQAGRGLDSGLSALTTAGLASRVLAAQEEERSRIGRELHDDIGQQAASLATRLATLMRTPRLSGARLREGLTEAGHAVQELASAIHQLSHQLHSPKLRLLGLVKALDSLCRNVGKDSGLTVTFSPDGIPPDVPDAVALCACRVAQEALQNAVKHSGATAIDVDITGSSSLLSLRVTDNGRGFDPRASQGSGIGLLSMRERVELNGGRLAIHTEAARGTTIEAALPLAAGTLTGHDAN